MPTRAPVYTNDQKETKIVQDKLSPTILSILAEDFKRRGLRRVGRTHQATAGLNFTNEMFLYISDSYPQTNKKLTPDLILVQRQKMVIVADKK